jgi:formylglycine-generating enzyme required for sulfatase activity
MKRFSVSFVRLPRVVFMVGVAALLGSLAVSAHAQVTLDMVTVGDPGNANDTTGYGAVNDAFRIAKFETTIGQYTAFLNAVAATDTYALYNPNMGSLLSAAGISRSGSSGSYTYSVMNNAGSSADRPISNVSWFDAARFANWMHNGQGSGDTETGAYTLSGATSGNAPAANSGAQVYIPTVNQWYKAAYYKGGGTNAGYWDNATQSDSAPGNTIGSGTNQANYYNGVYSVTQSANNSSSQNYLTDVGAFTNSQSAYGTFDQSGSVWEWNDLAGAAGPTRRIVGGAWWYLTVDSSCAIGDIYGPSDEYDSIGFRLASPVAVPEPSTCASLLAGLACGGYSLFRRRRAR